MRNIIAAITACLVLPAHAQTSVIPWGEAANYAVLGDSTVTNTGGSVIFGDVGVSSGTSITGFPPGEVTEGTFHSNDASAIQAHDDAVLAYGALLAELPTEDLSGQDLGSDIRVPGVYFFSSSAGLADTLILDGQGQLNPVFIFQIGSTLTTASGATILLINGASAENVFFQVGSSATIGTGTTFEGSIIANDSITMNTGANLNWGRLIALNGAVTLDSNIITIPEPSVALLMIPGLALLSKRTKSVRL